MNMKKMKKFFTLSRRAEGFTLVELIVVIAILAILGGVALPAYSGYIKKAHMAADQTMISDVAKALQLQYYSNPNQAVTTYIVISESGARAMGEAEDGGSGASLSGEEVNATPAVAFADKAMTGVFGENWRETVALEYNEWGLEEGVKGVIDDYSEEQIERIANSTFANQASTQGMLDTVTKLTGIVDKTISGATNQAEKLANLLGPDNSVTKGLKDAGLEPGDDGCSTAMSNLLVGYFADEISKNDGSEELDPLVNLCATYATAYAYAEATGDTAALAEIDAYISGLSYDDLDNDHGSALGEKPGMQRYMTSEYAIGDGSDTVDLTKTQGAVDSYAFIDMMAAVGVYADGFTDKAALTDPGLYGSEKVAAQLSGYISAVKALADMKPEEREAITNLDPGKVAVMIAADGSVSVMPQDAWAA